ncbi:phosphoribosylanthranilate isomerase [Puniceicoccaceae bacterium K14]|nr:phosphoribosylanthranilate isomerase [Puniceicoccaceae bacterium K14]
MGEKIKFKVCGLTRAEDAVAAAGAGANCLGFIFYPKSPRGISLADFRAMKAGLPDLPKVAVLVTPETEELQEFVDEGFDFFQVHFPVGLAKERISGWAQTTGSKRLWLVPKIAPDECFDEALLELADTILWDGFKKDAFGGTGKTSNWDQFRELKERFSQKQWILSGGLGLENLAAAIAKTDASFVDLNSGVEISPGIKDHEKLSAVKSLLSSD